MFTSILNAFKIWRYAKLAFMWLCRYVVVRQLKKIRNGSLTVIEYADDGSVRYERCFGAGDLSTTIYVNNRMAYWHWIYRGDIGLGDSYGHGYWSANNLLLVLRIFARNIDVLKGNLTWLGNIRAYLDHRQNTRNTLDGSRNNISAHYDLSNSFFASFLDTEMQYSCGVFRSDSDTTLDASMNKMERIAEYLDIGGDDYVLDIGCGWGQLAIYLAERYRVHVVGITTSSEQLTYCLDQLALANESSSVDLLSLVEYRLMDYRELLTEYGNRSFDKIVSIEMIEHVGEDNLEEFVGIIADLMISTGSTFIQGIIMPDSRYDSYCTNTDFIKEFIFPGGHLISDTIFRDTLDLEMLEVSKCENVTPMYAKMCAMWADAYENSPDPYAKGGHYFYNIWMFYLLYCSAGFHEDMILCNQYVIKHSE